MLRLNQTSVISFRRSIPLALCSDDQYRYQSIQLDLIPLALEQPLDRMRLFSVHPPQEDRSARPLLLRLLLMDT